MYIPPQFAETRPDELARIMRSHSLGVLLTHGDAGLDADHIPFEYDPGSGGLGRLSGHVARQNPLLQHCHDGAMALVVFRGLDAYISPNWYPSKQETHQQVPTWNYEVVHAHGRLTFHDDARYVRRVLAHLTRHHESQEPVPWRMGDAPPAYLDAMLSQIVGIEIELTALQGKVKMSQNKEARDRLGAAAALEAKGCTEMAHAMRAGG